MCLAAGWVGLVTRKRNGGKPINPTPELKAQLRQTTVINIVFWACLVAKVVSYFPVLPEVRIWTQVKTRISNADFSRQGEDWCNTIFLHHFSILSLLSNEAHLRKYLFGQPHSYIFPKLVPGIRVQAQVKARIPNTDFQDKLFSFGSVTSSSYHLFHLMLDLFKLLLLYSMS